MAKIPLDKYYTSKETAKYCINKTYEKINTDNITEIVEPSAGNGSFSLQINNCVAYDLEPEHDSIIKQDFIDLNVPYKKGRLIIGNPPFGDRMSLAREFFKKSVGLGDYISFILPISQLWNTNSLYQFDLIHSEDLGKVEYSDRKIHCCLNVYKRPENGLNKKKKEKLETVKIIRQDSKKYDEIKDFDIRMCYWGWRAGKILKDGEQYAGEYKIKIDEKFKNKVIDVLENVNWRDELNFIAMGKIQQFHIIKVLKKYIKDIY